jgi:hypothetical protein
MRLLMMMMMRPLSFSPSHSPAIGMPPSFLSVLSIKNFFVIINREKINTDLFSFFAIT